MSDVVDLATKFVAIPSASHHEAALASTVEELLLGNAHLRVTRVRDNVVAKTNFGCAERVIIAGHLDTVPLEHTAPEKKNGELWGLGVVDMKGTLAAMALLAQEITDSPFDLTWIFYAKEEIGRSESGLREIAEHDETLLDGDVAILGEPTNGIVEAGCQGTLHVLVTLGGVEAHSARPYMGVNAIHRTSAVLERVTNVELREVPIDGVIYSEQLQAVAIDGGRARNVVPGSASITLNYRFAPDRTAADATLWIRSLLDPVLDASQGDSLEVLEGADGALPNLGHPVLARLVELSGGDVAAKVGWTDVATFAGRGIPAANFGAGDPLLAHHLGERVEFSSLEGVKAVLERLLQDSLH